METPNIKLDNEQLIAAQTLARYRATAQEYGRFFGAQIFTIITTNPDLKWKEDVLADKNVLRKEVPVFLIKPIDVMTVGFLPKDLDGEPKIVLNEKSNDPNLVFPLVKPDFTKATRETVRDCIDRIGKKGSKPLFFAAEELPMLNDLLKVHNNAVINFYEENSMKFLKLAETVRNMVDQSDRLQSEYLRQCGVSEENVNISVNIEVKE